MFWGIRDMVKSLDWTSVTDLLPFTPSYHQLNSYVGQSIIFGGSAVLTQPSRANDPEGETESRKA